jgi:hypothetical protein
MNSLFIATHDTQHPLSKIDWIPALLVGNGGSGILPSSQAVSMVSFRHQLYLQVLKWNCNI